MQTAFDKASAHLLKQNEKSFSYGSSCAYRGEYGTMCAIGVLIPDEMYDINMEGNIIEDAISNFKSLKNLLPIDTDFLFYLQFIHDRKPVSEWREYLIKLAEQYNLNHNL